MLRGKGDGQVLELVVVQRQDGEIQILQLPALHGLEIVLREQFRQLDLPLAPAAAEDHRVVIPDAADGGAVLGQHHGLQMIVVQPRGIGLSDGLRQLGAAVIGCRHQKTSLMFPAVFTADSRVLQTFADFSDFILEYPPVICQVGVCQRIFGRFGGITIL